MITRKMKFASLMVVCLMSTVFFSCKDDKDEPKKDGVAIEVAGSYSGDMVSTVMGQTFNFYDLTFVVTAEDEDDVTITIPEYEYMNMQFPEIIVKDVDVSESNGVYEFETTEFSGTFESGTAYSGHIGGTLSNKTLTLNIAYNIGAMPPMVCVFISK